MSLNTLELLAGTQAFALPLVEDEVVGQVLDDVERAGTQLLKVEVLNALVVRELRANVLTVTDLAHHLDVGTLVFNVVVELSARHMLEFLSIANVTAKLRTVELCMRLQFSERLPDNFALAIRRRALMRELTEVNTVLKNFVDRLEEVTTDLTVGAAHLEVRRGAGNAILG